MSVAAAASGASNALKQILAERFARAQAEARQRQEQEQLALQQQQEARLGAGQRADETYRTGQAEIQRQQMGRLTKRDEVEDARYAEGANLRGLDLMKIEGDLSPITAEAENARTIARTTATEGVQHTNRMAEIAETGKQSRLTQAERQATPGSNPGRRALAELTARTGRLPAGTPTQSGEIMQDMASDPALLAQYDDARMAPIRAQAQTITTAIDDLLTPEGTLTEGGKAMFGELTPVFARGLRPDAAGSSAAASLRQVIGQGVVDLIREMKGQSQTGATGFGQLNMRELDIILAAATRLTQRIPEATAQQDLATLREKWNKVLQPSTTTPATGNGGGGSFRVVGKRPSP